MTPLARATAFTLLATVLALPLAGVAWWAHGEGPVWMVATVLYMGTPLLATLVFNRIDGQPWRHRLAVRFRRTWAWLAAWLLPMAIALGALGVSVALPGVAFDAGLGGVLEGLDPTTAAAVAPQLAELPPAWVLIPLMLLSAAIAGTTINALAAFGEEAGWRGWMHDELAPLGFWPRVGVTGVLWGLWHTPLILQGHNYPEHPVLGVGMMVAMCVGLSGPMAELRDRTDSPVAAAVFHGVFNGVAGLPTVFLVGGNDLTNGVTGGAGIVVLVGVNLALTAARSQRSSLRLLA